MIKYIVILILVCIFVISNKKIIEKMSNKKRFCIILTTHITNENINMYFKRLNMWLKTGIDIYLVDSNNRGFKINNKKYKQYIFDQTKEKYYNPTLNISILEIESLNRIINHFNLTNKYDYIYKITGKYFIDDYKSLNVTNNKYDLILQSIYRLDLEWHNSELVGFKSTKILQILSQIMNHGDSGFERGLGWLKTTGKYKYKILNKLDVNNKYGYVKRRHGDILKYL